MIEVRVPESKKFNYEACKKLYDESREKLKDVDFDTVIKHTYFYAFHIKRTGELLGCIYYYQRDNNLFVNVFAARGHHLLNIECFKESLKWWTCNVYAEATEPESRLGCIRCGFKRIEGNLFVYRR